MVLYYSSPSKLTPWAREMLASPRTPRARFLKPELQQDDLEGLLRH